MTCLARGQSGATAAGCALVKADRDSDLGLASVAARRWDSVIDVGRQPAHVRRAVRDLGPVAGSYLFVSTVRVYAETTRARIDESAPTLDPSRDDIVSPQEYGEGKVACENYVTAGVGDRSMIVRAGLLGGPGDVSGRSGYWPWRFATANGSGVLVPAAPDQPLQMLDVRDLAAWLVTLCEYPSVGTFNATGADTTLGDTLLHARAVSGSQARPVPIPGAMLIEQGVRPWLGPRSLPLWSGDAVLPLVDSTKAAAAGLTRRPVDQTLSAALEYERHGRTGAWPRGSGLSDADEADLLGEVLRTAQA